MELLKLYTEWVRADACSMVWFNWRRRRRRRRRRRLHSHILSRCSHVIRAVNATGAPHTHTHTSP